jgi:hypothetical protein
VGTGATCGGTAATFRRTDGGAIGSRAAARLADERVRPRLGGNPAKSLVRAAVDRTYEYVSKKEDLQQKTSPLLKAALRSLWMEYHSMARRDCPLPSIWDTGFRVFSEYDEDGVIVFLLAVVGSASRRFVDIGSGDGMQASNCANLAFNFGFHGLFVDANERSITRGRAAYAVHPDTRRYPPQFVNEFVKAETINVTIRGAGFEGDVDLLSIDIDGNDYWIWKAIDCISPRIVVIETHVEHGLEDVNAPYDENYVWHQAPAEAPVGASPVAMTKLGHELGYRLVGANRLGFNAVYVRNDLASGTVPTLEVPEILWHARNEPFVGARA